MSNIPDAPVNTEVLPPSDTAAGPDGWQVSFDCPDHGLVYGAFVGLENSPNGIILKVKCEGKEFRRLACYRYE